MTTPPVIPLWKMRALRTWREVPVDELLVEQDPEVGTGLLDVHAVAERMNISRRSLDRMISILPSELQPHDVGQGKARARWRWRAEDVETWIARVDIWQKRHEVKQTPKTTRKVNPSATRAVTDWRKELLG